MRIRAPRVCSQICSGSYSTSGTACAPLPKVLAASHLFRIPGINNVWGQMFCAVDQCFHPFSGALAAPAQLLFQFCAATPEAAQQTWTTLCPLPSLVLFHPWVCVQESWRRVELMKDESRKMQVDVGVPEVTKTSARWQKFTFQGFQFSHFYQWTEMKTKVLSLLQDSNRCLRLFTCPC